VSYRLPTVLHDACGVQPHGKPIEQASKFVTAGATLNLRSARTTCSDRVTGHRRRERGKRTSRRSRTVNLRPTVKVEELDVAPFMIVQLRDENNGGTFLIDKLTDEKQVVSATAMPLGRGL